MAFFSIRIWMGSHTSLAYCRRRIYPTFYFSHNCFFIFPFDDYLSLFCSILLSSHLSLCSSPFPWISNAHFSNIILIINGKKHKLPCFCKTRFKPFRIWNKWHISKRFDNVNMLSFGYRALNKFLRQKWLKHLSSIQITEKFCESD